jgi:hypothetical protein
LNSEVANFAGLTITSPWVGVEPKLLIELQGLISKSPDVVSWRFGGGWCVVAEDDSYVSLGAYSKLKGEKYCGPDSSGNTTGENRHLSITGWGRGDCGYGGSCASKSKVEKTLRDVLAQSKLQQQGNLF